MKKIITPGIFLLAALLTTACTDTEDIVSDKDKDGEAEPPGTDPAQCCAPDIPRSDRLIYDSFDVGRRARTRFDWLRNVRSN